ncbi:MAG: TonB-dependent receptor [Bacteroidetes bacterium]|nr:TonB-dependent receptor [Bacteroidota bacterium]MDA0903310.1 TonB-dependent receptor [Bacteroidota bacterium]MDA1242276.1 TonB-dependent receptor [Bacteroidota bacterium]
MTQSAMFFRSLAAMIALSLCFNTPVLNAQLDVDTLNIPIAMVSALQAAKQDPFAVTNLEVEDIQKQDAAQDVPFLLRLTPSAVVSSDAGHGIGYTALRIRGVDQSRINVTINGVPLNDAESQGVFWVDLPDLGSSMTGLQIQRGVGTSTNGPAAFGATVSVNTLGTIAKPGIRAVLGGGSFGTQRRTLAWNTGMLHDGWSLEGRASRITSDGWVDRASSDLSSLYGRVAKRWQNGRLSFTTTLGHERTYQAWYGVPHIVADPESTEDDILAWVQGSGEYSYGADTVRVNDLLERRAQHNYYRYENEVDDYRQDHYQIHLDQMLGDWNFGGVLYATFGAGYYEQFRQDDDLLNYGLDPLVMGADTLFVTDLVRRRWLDNTLVGTSWTLSRSSRPFSQVYGVSRSFYAGDHFGELIWMDFAAGAEPGDEYYRSLGEKTDLSAFGKWSGEVSGLRWHVEAHIRQVLYQTSGRDNDYSLIDIRDELTFFNPKAGLTWTPSEMLQGFVSAAVAHREPSRSDYLDSPQDSPLRPERLLDLEAGAKTGGDRWAAGVTLYNMQYTDQLVATGQLNDVGNVVRVNVADSHRRGAEFEAGVQLTPALRLDANASFSQNRIAQFEETVYDYDSDFVFENIIVHENTDIALSPNVVAMGMLTVEAPKESALAGLSVSLIGKHVGQQFLDNTSHEGRALSAYTTLDAVLRAERVLTTGQTLTLSLFGNNLLDVVYSATGWTYTYMYGGLGTETTENFVYPQAGRHGFLTLAVEF